MIHDAQGDLIAQPTDQALDSPNPAIYDAPAAIQAPTPAPSAPEPEMPLYVGTKVLKARPMTRGEYNAYRGWDNPAGEEPTEPGMLVEYTGDPRPNHPKHEGYISWSPLDVFEASYRPLGTNPIDESDAAFVLRAFGIDNASKYLIAPGVVDRSALAHDVESYRSLFANRVLAGKLK